VLLLFSSRARAADPTPEDRDLCVKKHESAQISRRDGKLRAANAALITCSRAVCPAAIRSDCGEWLAEVERSMPTVVLAVRSPKGDESVGRVLMDGEVFATRLDGQPLEVDPGAHVFRFEIPPYEPIEERTIIRTGEKNRELLVTVGKVPGPDAGRPSIGVTPLPPIEEYRPVPAAAWALGAVALAGLGAFGGLGGSGLAMKSSLSSSCAPFCTNDQIQPLRARFLAADISLGVAVAAATAAIVVLVRRPAVRREPSFHGGAASGPTPRAPAEPPHAASPGLVLGLRGAP
jgi:hypothetical protein